MNEREYLIGVAAEEAGEIAQAALNIQRLLLKTNRFGNNSKDSIQEGRLDAAVQELRKELNDFMAVIVMMEQRQMVANLTPITQILEYDQMKKKIDRVTLYMRDSIRAGALDLPEPF